MEFRLDSVDWGNVADWASVAVTLFVGVVALRLTAAANRLADDAHRNRTELERRELVQIALTLRPALLAALSDIQFVLTMVSDGEIGIPFKDNLDIRSETYKVAQRIQLPQLATDITALAKLPSDVARDLNEAYALIGTASSAAQDLVEPLSEGMILISSHMYRNLFSNARTKLEKSLKYLNAIADS